MMLVYCPQTTVFYWLFIGRVRPVVDSDIDEIIQSFAGAGLGWLNRDAGRHTESGEGPVKPGLLDGNIHLLRYCPVQKPSNLI